MGATLAVLFVAFTLALALHVTLSRCLWICVPGEALVIMGRERVRPDGSRCGYRVVTGGRVVVMPIIESVQRLDLRPFDIEVDGATARLAVSPDPPLIDHAIERFLGLPREELITVARDLVARRVREGDDPARDLAKLGLVVVSLERDGKRSPQPAPSTDLPPPRFRDGAEAQPGQRCPFCREGLDRGGPLASCDGCGTAFHRACATEAGACTTQGCGNQRRRARVPG